MQELGLIPWIAKGNVEMLQWYRTGQYVSTSQPLLSPALQLTPTFPLPSLSSSNSGLDIVSDIPSILGRNPTRFGDFVASYLKPMLQH